jgi:hypothetical protein
MRFPTREAAQEEIDELVSSASHMGYTASDYRVVPAPTGEKPEAEAECPRCHSGTIGLECGRLVCRGECGHDFGSPTSPARFYDNDTEKFVVITGPSELGPTIVVVETEGGDRYEAPVSSLREAK